MRPRRPAGSAVSLLNAAAALTALADVHAGGAELGLRLAVLPPPACSACLAVPDVSAVPVGPAWSALHVLSAACVGSMLPAALAVLAVPPASGPSVFASWLSWQQP